MTISTRQILSKIGSDKLSLYRAVGEAYWYFVYDDEDTKIYETHTILTPRLNDLDLDTWIHYGKLFVAECSKGK